MSFSSNRQLIFEQGLSANSGSVLTRSYGYDDWGNLTSATMGGTSNTLASYTLNYAANGTGAPATNRINTITEGVNHTVGHDGSGNLTSDNSTGATYTYDGAARLATATTATSSYEYDGDGWRVKQVASSTSTFYLWSSIFGQPALELNSSGNVVRAYVFSSSGQRIALQASNGSFYWVHGDHLGSSHMLTDTSGSVAYRAEYDPHGNLRLETGTTTLTTRKFTGYERDAANLDFAQARTYGYRRGRFMQPDPLGLGAGDATNPQSLNLYGYVQNDPINLVDPTGLNCRAYTYEWSGWVDGGHDGRPTHVEETRVVWVCDGNFGGGGGGGNPFDYGGGGGGGGTSGGSPPVSTDGNTKAFPGAIGLCGVSSSVAEYSNQVGNSWRGTNGNWYPTTWGGNQHTGARSAALSRAADYRFLGKAMFGVGAAISGVQGVQALREGNYSGAGKSGLDIGMGAIGVAAGPWGAAVSGAYYGIDTFVGWDRAGKFVNQNAEYIGRFMRESGGSFSGCPAH